MCKCQFQRESSCCRYILRRLYIAYKNNKRKKYAAAFTATLNLNKIYKIYYKDVGWSLGFYLTCIYEIMFVDVVGFSFFISKNNCGH